jgi:hypothetical protein
MANKNIIGARLIAEKKTLVEKAAYSSCSKNIFKGKLHKGKRDFILKILALEGVSDLCWLSKHQCPDMICFPNESVKSPKI